MTPIDPKFKSAPRPGLQANLTFDNKSVSANPAMFKEVQQILGSVHGMEGAGGERAQKIKTGTSYVESRGYTQTNERDTVLRRLENQFTDKLNSTYGSVAQNAGMSVPEYLQTQGIHGVQEVGSGDDRRMSAFKKASFRKISYNPLMSSNDKANRAAVKNAGFAYDNSGANESRRGTAIVPAAIAQEIEDRTRKLAVDLDSGLANTGDLEGSYLTKAQKFHVRNKKKTVEKAVSAGNIYSEDPALVERVRSEILEAEQMRSLKKNLKKDMQDEGLLEPDPDKEDKSGSGKGNTAKAAIGVGMSMLATVKKIGSQISTAIGYLKGIASLVGNILKGAPMAGLTFTQLTQSNAWGRRNSAYNAGNENIATDTFGAAAKLGGNIIRMAGNDFTEAGYGGYGHLIKGSIEYANNKDSYGLTSYLYGNLAQEYFKTAKENRPKLLQKQSLMLSSVYPGMETWYGGLIQKNDARSNSQYNKKPEAAYNIVPDALKSVSWRKVEDSGGYMVAKAIGGVTGSAIGDTENVASLNDLLGILQAIQDALMGVVLANMDRIVGLLIDIAKAILSWIPGETSKNILVTLNEVTKQQAAEGLTKTLTVRAKAEENAVTQIQNLKGYKTRGEAREYLRKHRTLKSLEADGKFLGTKGESTAAKQLIIDIGQIEKLDKRVSEYAKQKLYKGGEKSLGGGLVTVGLHDTNNMLEKHGFRITGQDYIDAIYNTSVSGKILQNANAGFEEQKEIEVDKEYDRLTQDVNNVNWDVEQEREAKKKKAGIDAIDRKELEKLKGGGKLDLQQQVKEVFQRIPSMNPYQRTEIIGMNSPESLGGSLITHNVVITVNGKEVENSSEKLDKFARERNFISRISTTS